MIKVKSPYNSLELLNRKTANGGAYNQRQKRIYS